MTNLAMAVVIRDGRVLVQRRRRRHGFVTEFPGGVVEGAETPVQAAYRELHEEVGMGGGDVVAISVGVNEFDGQVFYVVMSGLPSDEPRAVDPAREQTFFWLAPGEIPLDSFHRADIEFISGQLGRFACDIGEP